MVPKYGLTSLTKLDFPSRFNENSREVTISGEAYLRVAKNPSRPFIVHLPKATVQVTGTEFNVNSYIPTLTQVALVEGGVNLSAGDSTVKIKAGNQAIYNSVTRSTFQQTFVAKKILSWRKGVFYFESASLEEISPVLARWYGIKTKIDNAEQYQKKIFRNFDKNEPIDGFLDDSA